ncbi:unnamed protein product [Phyllotreta striolata]|uniref:molybdopterin adenylyltransferase n=1 Tax=Phyllotreta striolata TaxID=444603 RepID=A0A9N9TWG5_PHYSR|nr:unnamed protein product [Phyllotreta striolata]
MPVQISFGILTGKYDSYADKGNDLSSPKLIEEILKEFPSAEISAIKIVPVDMQEIKSTLTEWFDLKINVIFTTGNLPDMIFAMITSSLKIIPIAMLSRPLSGIRDNTMIVNLPGSPEMVSECFGIIKEALPRALELLTEQKKSVVSGHEAILSDSGASVVPTTSSSKVLLSGIRDNTMIVNLPGSPEMVSECLGIIKEALPRALELLTEQKKSVVSGHGAILSDSGASVVPTTSSSKVKLAPLRKYRYPIIDVEFASDCIKDVCSDKEVTTETVPLERSLNRIVAEDIHAEESIPSFPTSFIDGYAVKSSNGKGIRVVKNVATAGDKPIDEVLQSGEAIRISMGEPIPAGADAVVPLEDTSVVEYSIDGSEVIKVKIKRAPNYNENIRIIGSDVSKNSLVLKKGERIKHFSLGVLAMLGKTNILVYKRPSIGVISIGNYICEPKEKLAPGKIRDANRFTLINLLKNYRYKSNDCGIAKDNPDAIKQALEQSFTCNDVIIISSAMGELDMLKRVLVEDFQATIHFCRIKMKPGKYTTFATLMYNETWKMVFGLTGYPSSCAIICILFVIPALRFMEKSPYDGFVPISVPPNSFNIRSLPSNNDDCPEYRLVKVNRTLTGMTTAEDVSRTFIMPVEISFAILTGKYDSSYADKVNDLSSPKLKEEILKEFPSAEIRVIKIIPDDLQEIKSTLTEWFDLKINVIFTTGNLPDMIFAVIISSLKIIPIAMLSRPLSGIRDNTMIVNLPGSPEMVSECFGIIKEALPRALELLTEQKKSVVSGHEAILSDSGASVVPTTSLSKTLELY